MLKRESGMRGAFFRSVLLAGALALGLLPAGLAQAQAPREGAFGGVFDQRLVPLRERRGEAEWPPAEQPWLASQARAKTRPTL